MTSISQDCLVNGSLDCTSFDVMCKTYGLSLKGEIKHPKEAANGIYQVTLDVFRGNEKTPVITLQNMIAPNLAAQFNMKEEELTKKKERLFTILEHPANKVGYGDEKPATRESYERAFTRDSDRAQKGNLYTGYYILQNDEVIGRGSIGKGYSNQEDRDLLQGHYEPGVNETQMGVLIDKVGYIDAEGVKHKGAYSPELFETTCKALHVFAHVLKDYGYERKLKDSGNFASIDRFTVTVIKPDITDPHDRYQATKEQKLAYDNMGLKKLGTLPAEFKDNYNASKRTVYGLELNDGDKRPLEYSYRKPV